MTEAKRCKTCGSYAFNLDKEGINQQDLCDVHYWKNEFMKASAVLQENEQELEEQLAADSMDQQDL